MTPRWPLAPLLLSWFACSPAEPPDPVQFVLPVEMQAPVGGVATSEGSVTNLDPALPLIVGAFALTPEDVPLSLTGDGPWTIEPFGSRPLTLTFRPKEVGEWVVTATIATDAGDRSASIRVAGTPPIDADKDGYFDGVDDCDDSDPAVSPAAVEICDARDNDCDADVDEGFDTDYDGYLSLATCPELGDDCNDRDQDVFPGNVETCTGTDSDCNGIVDDIADLAGKQLGVCKGATKRCTAGGPVEPVYELLPGYESAERSCDGKDNDCDGSVDLFDRLGDGTSDCTDDDGDGEREVDGDCDDRDFTVRAEDCRVGKLVVTRNDDGFAILDLRTGIVDLYPVGMATYHGVALDKDTLWFAARDERRLIRYELASKSAFATTRLEVLPWAVEVDGRDLLVLLGDGRVQRRDPEFAGLRGEISLGPVKPTAWTADGAGTYWTCTSDGWLIHHNATTVLKSATTGSDCYGPPALRGAFIAVPGLLDQTLTGLSTADLSILFTRTGRKAAVRPVWAKDELWVSSAVDYTVEIHDSGLLYKEHIELDAQTQGTWYDADRDWVWVAVYGSDEVVAIERKSRKIVTRIAVPAPIYLFPLP